MIVPNQLINSDGDNYSTCNTNWWISCNPAPIYQEFCQALIFFWAAFPFIVIARDQSLRYGDGSDLGWLCEHLLKQKNKRKKGPISTQVMPNYLVGKSTANIHPIPYYQ